MSLISLFQKTIFISTLVVLLSTSSISAQNTLEFVQDGFNNTYRGQISKGPTSASQALTFFFNKDGSLDQGIYFLPMKHKLTVTVSLEDQTFTDVPQHQTGISFGATSGASPNQVKSTSVFNTNYQYTDTTRVLFTSHPLGKPGKGINLSMNPGLQLFLSAKPLYAMNAPKSDTSRYYYGRVRLVFDRPVSNPVISLIGLGASTNFAGKKLGFATELDLLNPGLKLTRLSGNDQMKLDPNQTKILHSKEAISGSCETGAACGSLLVRGENIDNLVFGVYLRADGGTGAWGTPKVTNSGDMWHLVISLPEQ